MRCPLLRPLPPSPLQLTTDKLCRTTDYSSVGIKHALPQDEPELRQRWKRRCDPRTRNPAVQCHTMVSDSEGKKSSTQTNSKTFVPKERAISTVRSLLLVSTTTISSKNPRTDCRQLGRIFSSPRRCTGENQVPSNVMTAMRWASAGAQAEFPGLGPVRLIERSSQV